MIDKVLTLKKLEMKKQHYFTCFLFAFILTNSGHAQIKVFDDNFITLGSLSKGGYGFNMQPNGYSYFKPSIFVDYGWMNAVDAPCETSKCYIVGFNNEHTFFVYGDGIIVGRDLNLYSDSTLKREISSIRDALPTILKLRGVTFRYKEPKMNRDTIKFKDKFGVVHNFPPPLGEKIDTTYVKPILIDSLRLEAKRKNYGVIAQEVEQCAPDLVRTTPEGLKTVNYISIIGLMIEAIKEQQNQIVRLNEQYTLLEGHISSLKESSLNTNEKQKASSSEENVLFQNSPNPFSQSTIIRFCITKTAHNSSLLIFNLQGALLKTYSNLVNHCEEVVIKASEFRPGMYIYSLIVDGKEIGTKRMILTE